MVSFAGAEPIRVMLQDISNSLTRKTGRKLLQGRAEREVLVKPARGGETYRRDSCSAAVCLALMRVNQRLDELCKPVINSLRVGFHIVGWFPVEVALGFDSEPSSEG